MLDPYRMVFVNTIASFLVLLGIVIYKFVYPKKKINLFVLLLLISVLPITSIFRAGTYESGDFNIHIYRMLEFYKSLTEGNIMPSWAGDLNATYGYPLFIFNYTLPYYIISLFHAAGLSFIWSLKIFLAVNIMLSGIFMFLFARKIFKNDLSAFISSIFYIFAPYHLIDIHFKIVIGEILFFTILPIVFFFAYNLLIKKTLLNIFLTSIAFAGLIMSHLVVAIFTGIFLSSYIVSYSLKNIFKNIFIFSIVIFISLLISLYQWLGPLLLSKYSFIQNVKIGTVYFPTIQDILYSPWRLGLLFQGPYGEISHLLGYVHIAIIVSLAIMLFKRKSPEKIYGKVLFWLISFFITLFFILPYSKTLWENLPIIKTAGSHRLLILTSFISSVLAGYFIFFLKKKWIIYVIIFAAITSTILNWGHRRVIPQIDDNVLKTNLWKSTSQGEGHFYANTKWVDIKNPWFSELPKSKIEILKGIGSIKNISRNSTKHQYFVNAQTELKIQENTLYFPGWNAKVNNKTIPIYSDDKGIILFNIPQGRYNFDLEYEDVPIYKTIKIISLASFVLTLICLLLIYFKNKYEKK